MCLCLHATGGLFFISLKYVIVMRVARVFTSSAIRRQGRRGAAVVCGLLLVLAGCRTYGRYDAQEKILPEMRQAILVSASDLERAESNLEQLRRAARNDSALLVVADEYAEAVARHAELLKENRRILALYEEDLPDYRRIHRTFGAMLSEQQAARNRYRSLTKAVLYPTITRHEEGEEAAREAPGRALQSLPDTVRWARDESFTEGRYFVAPVFYERLQSASSDLTMRQALAVRQQRRAQPGRLSGGEAQRSGDNAAASDATEGL